LIFVRYFLEMIPGVTLPLGPKRATTSRHAASAPRRPTSTAKDSNPSASCGGTLPSERRGSLRSSTR